MARRTSSITLALAAAALTVLVAPATAQAADSLAGRLDPAYGARGIVSIPVASAVRSRGLIVRPDGTSIVLAGDGRSAFAWRVSPAGDVRPLVGTTARIAQLPDGLQAVRLLPRADGGWTLVGTRGRGPDRRPVLLRIHEVADAARADDVTGAITGLDTGTAYQVNDAVEQDGVIVLVGAARAQGAAFPSAMIAAHTSAGVRLEVLALDDGWSRLSSVAAAGGGNFLATGTGQFAGTGYGYSLLSFTEALTVNDDFNDGLMFDPREHCQFGMHHIVLDGPTNLVVGNTWSCDGYPTARSMVVAQQGANGVSIDPFGSTAGHAGEGAVAIVPVPGVDWRGIAGAVDSAGRILVAGTSYFTPGTLIAASGEAVTTTRPLTSFLTSGGDFDSAYAQNELAINPTDTWDWSTSDAAFDGRDRAMLLGTADRGGRTEVRVARLLAAQQ